MKNILNRVRISSSALLKPAPVAGFILTQQNLAKTLPRTLPSYYYRKPKLVKGAAGWYIEYSYRIPVNLRHLYGGQTWYRFRLRMGMNRYKGKEREDYANWLLQEISQSLKDGYNPFQPDKEIKVMMDEIEQEENPERDEISIAEGIEFFIRQWKERGLDSSTMARYRRTANYLTEWLQINRIPHRAITEITSDNIHTFLSDLKANRGLSNREYNNQYDFTRTIFNFFVKKKFIQDNLMSDIPKLKTKSTKHRYYDTATLKKIITVLEATDPYTLFAFQAVYYLCIRAEKELMNLKTENILWEENRILLEIGKGNSERYIPMDANMKEIFRKRGIDKYPHGLYVFGIREEPSEQPFGRGFFSKRFRKVRSLAGLPSTYTLYSAKHTRVIHLKQDKLSDADIMSLTGHKDFSAYAKYLRDLGLEADPEKINKVSRKL